MIWRREMCRIQKQNTLDQSLSPYKKKSIEDHPFYTHTSLYLIWVHKTYCWYIYSTLRVFQYFLFLVDFYYFGWKFFIGVLCYISTVIFGRSWVLVPHFNQWLLNLTKKSMWNDGQNYSHDRVNKTLSTGLCTSSVHQLWIDVFAA